MRNSKLKALQKQAKTDAAKKEKEAKAAEKAANAPASSKKASQEDDEETLDPTVSCLFCYCLCNINGDTFTLIAIQRKQGKDACGNGEGWAQSLASQVHCDHLCPRVHCQV